MSYKGKNRNNITFNKTNKYVKPSAGTQPKSKIETEIEQKSEENFIMIFGYRKIGIILGILGVGASLLAEHADMPVLQYVAIALWVAAMIAYGFYSKKRTEHTIEMELLRKAAQGAEGKKENEN